MTKDEADEVLTYAAMLGIKDLVQYASDWKNRHQFYVWMYMGIHTKTNTTSKHYFLQEQAIHVLDKYAELTK